MNINGRTLQSRLAASQVRVEPPGNGSMSLQPSMMKRIPGSGLHWGSAKIMVGSQGWPWSFVFCEFGLGIGKVSPALQLHTRRDREKEQVACTDSDHCLQAEV